MRAAVVVGMPSAALATKALARTRRSLGGRPAASGRFGNEVLEADHVEGGDEPPERFGHRVDFLAKPRKQIALDVVPAPFHRVERIVGHCCC